MRLLLAIIFALFGAAGLATLLKEDPGYVLISIGHITVETSVAVLVIFLVAAFVVSYLLLRLLGSILRAPRRVAHAHRQWRLLRSYRLLAKGLQGLIEGRWKAAESSLMKGVAHSKAPVLHYIGAARAAHKLKETGRRDDYLHKADDLSDKEAFIAKLARAELYLENQAAVQARAVLERLHKVHPHQPRLLELLARCYQDLGDWEKLKDLLPALGKYAAPDESWLKSLRLQAFGELLAHQAHSGTLQELKALWKQMPEPLRAEESLLLSYVGHLRDQQAAGEAEALLRQALNRHWSDKLVVGYGELGRGNVNEQLHTAEVWLKQHGNDPYLLLTCGRLAKRGYHLGKARTYLEQSIKLLANPDAFQELGEVLDELGDKDGARQCYQRGLRLLSGRLEEKEGVALPPTGEETLPAVERPTLVKGTKPITPDHQASAS